METLREGCDRFGHPSAKGEGRMQMQQQGINMHQSGNNVAKNAAMC